MVTRIDRQTSSREHREVLRVSIHKREIGTVGPHGEAKSQKTKACKDRPTSVGDYRDCVSDGGQCVS